MTKLFHFLVEKYDRVACSLAPCSISIMKYPISNRKRYKKSGMTELLLFLQLCQYSNINKIHININTFSLMTLQTFQKIDVFSINILFKRFALDLFYNAVQGV